jgi:hypothetical protein
MLMGENQRRNLIRSKSGGLSAMKNIPAAVDEDDTLAS